MDVPVPAAGSGAGLTSAAGAGRPSRPPRATTLYPLLFAAFPALYLAASSPGQFGVGDLVFVLGVTTLVAALLVGATALAVAAVDRSQRRAARVGPVAMFVVAWVFLYLPAQQTAEAVSWRLSRHAVLVPLGLAATGLLLWWVLRQSREQLLAANRVLTLAGALVVALSVVRIAGGGFAPASARSPFARALAAPVRAAGPVAARNDPRRDIYLIVLDGHANDRVLREVFGRDQHPFTDSLRALGFTVPADVRSNYTQTVLSVPSLLNFEHVTRLAQDAGENSHDFALPRDLIAYNRTARFLKGQGYRYVLYPSAWWELTDHSPLADVRFDARPGFSLADEVRRTELRMAVANSTLLGPLLQRQNADFLQPLRSVAGLPAVAADPAPTFTFAHVLLPHPPFLVDADCRPVARRISEAPEANTAEQRVAYLGQMGCVDRLVLDAVRRILRASAVAPVVLIVGDHGSRFTDVHYYDHPGAVTPAFARERFGALGAFYLPGGGAHEFGDSVTLVNVMRNVLRYYFAADLPPLPDDSYVSGLLPYRFYHVDPRWIGAR